MHPPRWNKGRPPNRGVQSEASGPVQTRDVVVSIRNSKQSESPDEALATQKERLEHLRAGTEKLRSLRQRECELEVELIAAEAALRAETRKGGLALSPAQAAAIMTALTDTRRLQTELERTEQRAGTSSGKTDGELARLNAARDALQSWLEAPRLGRAPPLTPTVSVMLATASVVCIAAAVAVHPVMLVLLLPLLLPFAFLKWSRQNADWLKLGAKRHFRATGLALPAAWQAPAVTERLSELERSIESLSVQSEQPAEDGRRVQQEAELAQAEALLNTMLADVGLDVTDIDGDTARWLGLAAEAHAARKSLDQVHAQRARLQAESDEHREALFRFLSRQGEAPPNGHADLQTLAAGLSRVSHQRTG